MNDETYFEYQRIEPAELEPNALEGILEGQTFSSESYPKWLRAAAVDKISALCAPHVAELIRTISKIKKDLSLERLKDEPRADEIRGRLSEPISKIHKILANETLRSAESASEIYNRILAVTARSYEDKSDRNYHELKARERRDTALTSVNFSITPGSFEDGSNLFTSMGKSQP